MIESTPGAPTMDPVSAECPSRTSTSRPSAQCTAPPTSEAATTRYPRALASRAAHVPTLPNPWMATVVALRSIPAAVTAWSRQMMHPVPVASVRPGDPPSSTGLPVTTAGEWPARWEYSSTIQAMTWALVAMSGAGMSTVGPMMSAIARV